MINTKNIGCRLLLVFSIALVLFSASSVAAYFNCSIVNRTGATREIIALTYDTTSHSYREAQSGKPEVSIRIYSTEDDITGMWVGAVYRVGSTNYMATKGSESGTNLTEVTASATGCGASCYYADAPSSLDFLSDYAIFPGQLYTVISDDNVFDPDTDTFVFMNSSLNGWLYGSITVPASTIQSSYSDSTSNVTVSITSIYSGLSGTGTNIVSDGSYGSRNQVAVGICNASNGTECSSERLMTPSQSVSLYTGVSEAQAQSQARRPYVVTNGLAQQFCIGADFDVTAFTANNSAPDYGQTISLNATVRNIGNIDMPTTFYVTFWKDAIGGTLVSNQTVSGLNKLAYAYPSTTYTASGADSGEIQFWVIADYEGIISECDDSDNNASTTVDVADVYNVTLYINDVQSTVFPNASRPYNVTVEVTRTPDNDPVDNASVIFTETNGIVPFGPMQTWTESGGAIKKGVVSKAVSEILTNESGSQTFALVPTGNRIYDQTPEVSDYVGAYNLTLELFINGQQADFYNSSGSKMSYMPLTLSQMTPGNPSPSDVTATIYQDAVEYSTNSVFQIYTAIKEWLGLSS